MLLTLDSDLKAAAATALQQCGCVYIVGLNEIRRQTGERWERLKEMIWTRLDNLLRQKLGPTDFFIRVNDVAFLVSMPSVKREEAEIFCLRVAHELHTGLLGPCEAANLEVSRTIRFYDNTIETAPVDRAERGLPGAAGEAIENPPAPEPAHPVLDNGGDNRIHDIEVCYRFMPIWDAQKEAVASYRCLSLFDPALVESLGFDQRAKFELAATMMRLRYGTGMLSQRLAVAAKFLLWLPVSYEMLSSPGARMEISALCRGLTAELRNYIVFEISDLPYGVPQSRLSDLIGALRPYCRGVVACLPARIANYGAYLGVGLQAIGLSLLAGMASGTEMESEMFKLCAAARRQHIMCFVFDIPTEELLRAARALGVNMMSGPLIGSPLEAPAPVRRLLAKDIPRIVRATTVQRKEHFSYANGNATGGASPRV
jgi:hypothetical protein